MNTDTVLSVSGLGKDIGDRTLWDGIDLTLEQGATLVVCGPSGTGKSTFLNCIGGLDSPTRGRVHVDGVDLHGGGARVRRRLRREVIGVVVQDRAIVPEWTLAQNVGVVLDRRGDRRLREHRVREALLALGLAGKHRQRAGLLSGGEQQRAAVARVLVQRPRLVLADEPTASLDDESAWRVRTALGLLSAAGAAVVVATHDPALVAWADRALELGAPVGAAVSSP